MPIIGLFDGIVDALKAGRIGGGDTSAMVAIGSMTSRRPGCEFRPDLDGAGGSSR